MKIAGEDTHNKYTMVDSSRIVGKTIESVHSGYVQGAYGQEPVRFTDGTQTGFVLPAED